MLVAKLEKVLENTQSGEFYYFKDLAKKYITIWWVFFHLEVLVVGQGGEFLGLEKNVGGGQVVAEVDSLKTQ